jgi:hypothetical protein
MNNNPRSKVEALLAEARSAVSAVAPASRPPLQDLTEGPRWNQFELTLWSIGEQIRHAINSQPRLRSDPTLYVQFLSVAQDRRGMRGRQSFVLLFAYRPCVRWAQDLATLIPDPDIDGHIISVLYKMRACGFSRVVGPFASSSTTWIRKEARRYLSFDLDSPVPHERKA